MNCAGPYGCVLKTQVPSQMTDPHQGPSPRPDQGRPPLARTIRRWICQAVTMNHRGGKRALPSGMSPSSRGRPDDSALVKRARLPERLVGCGSRVNLSSHAGPLDPSRARSSRIRPANDRETSRNDGKCWSIESAGQGADSAIAAGSEIGPDNTLKVETRVRTPLGLPGKPQVRGKVARPLKSCPSR